MHQIETSLVSHFMDLVEAADKDKNGRIDYEEWEDMGKFSVGHKRLSNLTTSYDKSFCYQATHTYGCRPRL